MSKGMVQIQVVIGVTEHAANHLLVLPRIALLVKQDLGFIARFELV